VNHVAVAGCRCVADSKLFSFNLFKTYNIYAVNNIISNKYSQCHAISKKNSNVMYYETNNPDVM